MKSLLNEDNVDEFYKIPNIVFRIDDKFYTSPRKRCITDLDELPIIHDDFLSKYLYKKNSYAIDVGRGCPYSCTYCCTNIFWNKLYRLKTDNNLIEEIIYVKNNFGINNFQFQHDLFTVSKIKVTEFCKKIIEKKINITWGCSARVDTLNKDLINIMKESGCNSIFLGIETGSPNMQKKLNKNLNLEDVEQKVDLLINKNISVTCSFIYGFLEENEDDLKLTLKLALKLLKMGAIVQLHKFMAYPSTIEYNKVSDILFFNKNTINCYVTENKYLENLTDLISSDKVLFSNFYEFNTGLRENVLNLELFFYLFNFMYKYFKYITHKILEDNCYDLLTIYYNYERVIKNLKDNILYNIYDEIEVYDVVTRQYINTIREIVDYMKKTGDEKYILEQFFNFGLELNEFEKNKSLKNKILSYPINIVKLQLDNKLNNEILNEQITIELTKISNRKIKVKRIA